ncbi:MAG: tandem-95 repeat protein [Chloroflexi bacterium]|nr:tandem-95 repeat protein [Chloroflexota bacterium]
MLWRLPTARAEIPLPEPPSLKWIPIPEPPNLSEYARDRQAAIRLGKALFWDMQVGSDGIQACASCHFKAGADGRVKNQINPGANGTFQVAGPNATLTSADFPFHERQAPADQQESPVIRDSDDISTSQGMRRSRFVDISGTAVDVTTPQDDPVFNVGGVETRRVAGRNAPTVVNAVFNYANFSDGRANNIFNGVNPFGPTDLNARILVNEGGLQAVQVRIHNASLASQAVGPPLNDFEMSGTGRSFPKLGKKMLRLRPLERQLVHTSDSVLGALSRQNVSPGLRGLATSYGEMIQAAFQPDYWEITNQVVTFQGGVPSILPRPTDRDLTSDEFTQMEANFSLFFGLAIQLYEATLVSDDTLFDRVREGRATYTPIQRRGLDLFNALGCTECHGGAEFTNASFSALVFGDGIPLLVERMVMGDSRVSNYDTGFYNIGVTRTGNDIGRGGTDPFGYPLSFARLGALKEQGALPAEIARYVPDLPPNTSATTRLAVDGSFKTPSLRNVELTGPYFHNGSYASLSQVIEFYTRGGNFPATNRETLDPGIVEIGQLQGHPEQWGALVAFLLTLTDERVRDERAPFDHPEVFVPNGANDANPAEDVMVQVPAVGAAGRAAQGLPPLEAFLSANRAPIAADDVPIVPQNSVNYIKVLGNDGDLDGDAIAVVAVTQAVHGSTAVGPGGSYIVYTPTTGFAGFDNFTYTITDGSLTAAARVTVTVHAANRAPDAVAEFVNMPANSSVNAIEGLLNDRDQDGDSLTVVAVGQPAHGTTTIGPMRDTILYTPNPGFAGLDSFSHSISDGVLTITSMIVVTVNRPPVAANDSFTVPGYSVNNALRVLANDADPDPNDRLRVVAITPPYKGQAAIGPSDDVIIYTPRPGETGTDQFVYALSDRFLVSFATVTVDISGNRPPASNNDVVTVAANSVNNLIDVLANDAASDGGSLTITSVTAAQNGLVSIAAGGRSLLYTPYTGFVGTDTFTYTASDGAGAVSSATVTVTVRGPYRYYFPAGLRDAPASW